MTVKEIDSLIIGYNNFLKESGNKLSAEDIERVQEEIKFWERLLQIINLISTREYCLHKSKQRNPESYKPLLNGMDYKIVKNLNKINLSTNN